MNNLFQLLDTNFSVSWDIEKLTQDFPVHVSTGYDGVNADQTGQAHWQYFADAKIYFSRNFYRNYRQESHEIFDYIVDLQSKYKKLEPKSKLLGLFLEHELHPSFITIVKVDPESQVVTHIDYSRVASINIGVKNSHAGITHVWDGEVLPRVFINEQNVKYSYQMNDGHAYLLNTKQPHSVTPAVGVSLTRFIVSYSIE